MESSEYADYGINYMPMLELSLGNGFIAPGGRGNVDRIVKGVDLTAKKVVEFGSGLGGGAMI